VILAVTLVVLNSSRWFPTIRLNTTLAAENPTTSVAISRKENVCGGSTREVYCGVVPDNCRLAASKLIQEGKGELSDDTA
jgi:hypothetical protein